MEDLSKKIDNFYEKEEFPLLKYGIYYLASLLDTSVYKLKKTLKEKDLTKQKELRSFFSKYPPYLYTYKELADILKVSTKTISRYIKQRYNKTKPEINKKFINKARVEKIKYKEPTIFNIERYEKLTFVRCWFSKTKIMTRSEINFFGLNDDIRKMIYFLRKDFGMIIEYDRTNDAYMFVDFINSFFRDKFSMKQTNCSKYEHIIKFALEKRKEKLLNS